MNTQATITDRTEGFVQFSNGFTAERITTQMSGITMWVCRYPEGAEAKSFRQYRDAIAFCKAQQSMQTIIATGHNNGQFIWNAFDGKWDFADDVDTSHPRYEATANQLEAATAAAEGTMLTNIQIARH